MDHETVCTPIDDESDPNPKMKFNSLEEFDDWFFSEEPLKL